MPDPDARAVVANLAGPVLNPVRTFRWRCIYFGAEQGKQHIIPNKIYYHLHMSSEGSAKLGGCLSSARKQHFNLIFSSYPLQHVMLFKQAVGTKRDGNIFTNRPKVTFSVPPACHLRNIILVSLEVYMGCAVLCNGFSTASRCVALGAMIAMQFRDVATRCRIRLFMFMLLMILELSNVEQAHSATVPWSVGTLTLWARHLTLGLIGRPRSQFLLERQSQRKQLNLQVI